MKVTLLNTIVTLSGIFFFTVSLAVVVLGKKVGGKQSGSQKIKVGNYVEVNTNSVLTLVLITACFAITPLALTYWKPELTDYVAKSELPGKYLSIDDLSIDVYGAAVLEDGRFANNVDIEIIRTSRGYADTLKTTTGEQGDFLIKLSKAKPDEEYAISWAKPGYVRKNLRFRFNAYPYPITLTRQGGN